MNEMVRADPERALRLVDRIEDLFERKRMGRCSVKLHLEEYLALRFLVLVYEDMYGAFIADEKKFIEDAKKLTNDQLMLERADSREG